MTLWLYQLHMNDIPDCENGCYNLSENSRYSRAHHAPFKSKDKDRIQDDIDHCTGKRGCHGKLRTSVCSYIFFQGSN